MNNMTTEQCSQFVESYIRLKSRGLIEYNNKKDTCSDTFPPFGLECIRKDDNGNIILSDLALKIFDDIVIESQHNDIIKRGIEAMSLSKDMVLDIINQAELAKSLVATEDELFLRLETLHQNLLKANLPGHKIVRTKDHKTGDMVELKIPDYKDLIADDDKNKKIEAGSDAQENHTGKTVYFNPQGLPVIRGTVSGHGKHGVTIRDEKNKKHLIEHGKYKIHKGEDFGGEDYGDTEPPPKLVEKAISQVIAERIQRSQDEKFSRKENGKEFLKQLRDGYKI